jgi:hypothetical protein
VSDSNQRGRRNRRSKAEVGVPNAFGETPKAAGGTPAPPSPNLPKTGFLAFFTLKSLRLEQGLLDWKEIVCYGGSLKYG